MLIDWVKVYEPYNDDGVDCSHINEDPYANNAILPCCDGLIQCLNNWDNDGNWYYKCAESQSLCDNGEVSSPPTNFPTNSPTTPTDEQCTTIGNDPWSSGSNIPCCSNLETCLRNWNNDGNWFYICTEVDHCDDGKNFF